MIVGMDNLTNAAKDPESLSKSEELTCRWMKQIQKVNNLYISLFVKLYIIPGNYGNRIG